MPPVSENDPVTRDEKLLRRALHSDVRRGNPMPVARGAFTPGPRDTDGLSLFRSQLAKPQEVADDVPPERRGTFYVVEISATTIQNGKASVVPNPLPEEDRPRGHSLIPELAFAAYNDPANRKLVKELTLALAVEAGTNIRLEAILPVMPGGRR